MTTLIRWFGNTLVALHWVGPGCYLVARNGEWGVSLWPAPADDLLAQLTLRPVCDLTCPADAGFALAQTPAHKGRLADPVLRPDGRRVQGRGPG